MGANVDKLLNDGVEVTAVIDAKVLHMPLGSWSGQQGGPSRNAHGVTATLVASKSTAMDVTHRRAPQRLPVNSLPQVLKIMPDQSLEATVLP